MPYTVLHPDDVMQWCNHCPTSRLITE